jgi:hypothetical protein
MLPTSAICKVGLPTQARHVWGRVYKNLGEQSFPALSQVSSASMTFPIDTLLAIEDEALSCFDRLEKLQPDPVSTLLWLSGTLSPTEVRIKPAQPPPIFRLHLSARHTGISDLGHAHDRHLHG